LVDQGLAEWEGFASILVRGIGAYLAKSSQCGLVVGGVGLPKHCISSNMCTCSTLGGGESGSMSLALHSSIAQRSALLTVVAKVADTVARTVS
jgi:hypothetical protein